MNSIQRVNNSLNEWDMSFPGYKHNSRPHLFLMGLHGLVLSSCLPTAAAASAASRQVCWCLWWKMKGLKCPEQHLSPPGYWICIYIFLSIGAFFFYSWINNKVQICYHFVLFCFFPFLVKGQKLPWMNVYIAYLNWFLAKFWEKLNWLLSRFSCVRLFETP